MARFNTLRLARRLLAFARELAAAKLNDYQRGLIEEYSGDTLDFGDVIPWNDEGRAYFPVSRRIKDIEAPQEIVDALLKLGYSITSYRDGKAVKTIEVRDGKKTQVKNIGRILKNEVRDPVLSKEFDNRLGTTNKDDSKRYMVCITHNPEDVGAMSTGRNWTSCMELPEDEEDYGGMHYQTALSQVQYGGMCAYLIYPDDKTVEDPFARIAIKRLNSVAGNGWGSFIYKAENTIYGDEWLADECDMRGIVDRELQKSNNVTKKQYKFFETADPESYSDSGITTELLAESDEDILDMEIEEFEEYFSSSDGVAKLDSGNPVIKSIVREYLSKLSKSKADGIVISICNNVYENGEVDTYYDDCDNFLEAFIDFLDWEYVSIHFALSNEFMEKHADKIFWPGILMQCREYSWFYKNKYNYFVSNSSLYSKSDFTPGIQAILERTFEKAQENNSLARDKAHAEQVCEFIESIVKSCKPAYLNDFDIEKEINESSVSGYEIELKFKCSTTTREIIERTAKGSNTHDIISISVVEHAIQHFAYLLREKGNHSLDYVLKSTIEKAVKSGDVENDIIRKMAGDEHVAEFRKEMDESLDAGNLILSLGLALKLDYDGMLYLQYGRGGYMGMLSSDRREQLKGSKKFTSLDELKSYLPGKVRELFEMGIE